MFGTLVAFLVHVLIVGPFNAQLGDALSRMQAPDMIVSQVRGCASSAMPALIERVSADPMWGVSSAIAIWLGRSSPERLVLLVSPSCGPAIGMARNYLRERAA